MPFGNFEQESGEDLLNLWLGSRPECLILRSAALPENDADAFPPALVDANQGPMNQRMQVMQQSVGGWMDVESWRNQKEQRIGERDFAAWEVSG